MSYDLSDLLGMNISMDFYYENGKMYIQTGQSKMCVSQSLEEGLGGTSTQSSLPPREVVASLTSERKDGSVTATLQLDPDKAKRIHERCSRRKRRRTRRFIVRIRYSRRNRYRILG